MIILPIISIVTTVGYVSYIIDRFHGIPSSISESFYLLGGDETARLMFDGWAILTAAPIMYYMMDESTGIERPLSFLTGIGLMIVGYAPRFGWELERFMHFAATALAAGCAMLWCYFTGIHLMKLLATIILALAVGSVVDGINHKGVKRNTVMFFVEIAVFFNLFVHVIKKSYNERKN